MMNFQIFMPGEIILSETERNSYVYIIFDGEA